ncbi:SDR family oxidoreductase [Streptomyces malaysiensis]|uniref:Short-chain dehydrogenase/reductase SDR n=1 Tax=Streptomyces malaysiensis TaxID=92644 RepID=A0A7X5WWZ9_STRMQ|nr:SDR family oxidoreductase [Streptomyces malaysiensis]NIY62269.1 short-chain dehydrogenase/reductase SDR [Streptomyces malaysiensis]
MTATAAGCGVLVTGGSSGIGHAIARSLASQGADVVSAARRGQETGDRVRPLRADLASPGGCEDAVARAVGLLGRLDILVASAGTMLIDDVADASSADWRTMTSVNLTGTTECVRAALPHLLRASEGPRGCADIVVIGSISGRRPTPGRALYAATKAGLRAFTDSLRQELAPTPIRVSLVEPGLTATGLRAANSPETLDRMTARTPGLHTVTPLSPDDVAGAVTWLINQPAGLSVSEMTLLPTSQGA